jgi:hypothetical protein
MLESEYLGKIENEKRHSENLLRNILPAEIATRVRNQESNIADHFDDTTVIFAYVVAWSTPTALTAKQATSSHAAVDSGIPRESATVGGESTRL